MSSEKTHSLIKKFPYFHLLSPILRVFLIKNSTKNGEENRLSEHGKFYIANALWSCLFTFCIWYYTMQFSHQKNFHQVRNRKTIVEAFRRICRWNPIRNKKILILQMLYIVHFVNPDHHCILYLVYTVSTLEQLSRAFRRRVCWRKEQLTSTYPEEHKFNIF